MKDLSDLNFRDIEIFVLASRTSSLREVARQSGLQPAHISKIIKKFEDKMGSTLFRRTASGVVLTSEGLQLIRVAEQILENIQLLSPSTRKSEKTEKLWTIGAISFLASYLLAPSAGRWRAKIPHTRFRLIEFTHNQLVALGLQGAFEMAVHIGKLEWTHTWETIFLRKLSWKLYARKNHSLGHECYQRDLVHTPFVVPTDWHQHGYASGEDFCPFRVSQRQKGDEASTAETALELVSNSQQLTFVPEILARSWCESGQVQEVRVLDWPVVEKEIYLTVKADKVPQKIVNVLIDRIGKP